VRDAGETADLAEYDVSIFRDAVRELKGIRREVVAYAPVAKLVDAVEGGKTEHALAPLERAREHVHLQHVRPTVVVEVGDVDPHPGEARVLDRLRCPVGERAVAVVDIQDVVGDDVVGDVDVGPRVAVDVGDRDAEAVAGDAEDPRLVRHIREVSLAVVLVELIVAVRRVVSHPERGRREIAAREVGGGVVEHEQVEASVAVVVEEDGLRREAGVGDSVLRRCFREGSIPVVDEEQVGARLRGGPRRSRQGGVDVEVAVVVDVHHRDPGDPPVGRDPRLFGHVLEPHVALVEVQATRDHVAGEEEVGEPVVVHVADGDAGAIVDVGVGLDVEGVARRDGVREGDAGAVRAEQLEHRALARPAAEQREQRKQEREATRMQHAYEPRRRGIDQRAGVGRAREGGTAGSRRRAPRAHDAPTHQN
jgi:hypothetical protein